MPSAARLWGPQRVGVAGLVQQARPGDGSIGDLPGSSHALLASGRLGSGTVSNPVGRDHVGVALFHPLKSS